MKYSFSLILLSAGKGNRFKGKKQFHLINKKPLWAYSFFTFLKIKELKEIIIIIEKKEERKYLNFLKKFEIRDDLNVRFVSGGSERFYSSYNGILALKDEHEFVFIHDAARPFIHINDLKAMLALIKKKIEGIVPAEKLKDTIKIREGNYLRENLKREDLVAVSTPQIFPVKLIKKFYKKFIKEGACCLPTDDSELFLKHGGKVKLHWLKNLNPKLTDKNDLFLFNEIKKNL